MLSLLEKIWGPAEPIVFLVQLALGLRFKFHTKVTENQYHTLAESAFKEVESHLTYFKIKEAITGDKEMYLRHLKSELKKDGEFFVFLEGEIQLKLLQKFKLSEDHRIDSFLIVSFFFIHGLNKTFKYLLFKERIRKFFGKKYTFLHYLSIDGWRNLSSTELVDKVKRIKKIKPLWNERYSIPKYINIGKEKPTISRAIDNVLAKGKITERSIFNLATSEKLLFIHKYGEGFSEVYNQQLLEQRKIRQKIEKLEKSKAKNATKLLNKEKERLKNLNKDWLKVPIGVALENYGFQKLFNRMDGVYVLPLSLLPEKYHNSIDAFIEDVIIQNAKKYVNDSLNQGNRFLTEENKDLKYLIYSHIVPANNIKVLTEKRNVEVSSPTLSRMLFTSYLANENSTVSSLYINDIVRNVDFLSILKNNVTDTYIRNNYENIKRILWNKLKIDILKPFGLSAVLDNQLESVIDDILILDDGIKKYLLRNRLKNIIEFYKQLNKEIDEIKK